MVNSIDVGWLCSIGLRMIPSATDPEWSVDVVTVTNDGSGDTATFPYSSRLNTEKPTATIYKSCPLTDFKVQVYTSDSLDAGFDGDVYVQLEGMYGSSEMIPLVFESDDASFTPSSCQVLINVTPPSPSLGPLSRRSLSLLSLTPFHPTSHIAGVQPQGLGRWSAQGALREAQGHWEAAQVARGQVRGDQRELLN